MAVDDRLGKPGGAAGIDDPERMIERQPCGFEGVDLRPGRGQDVRKPRIGGCVRSVAMDDDMFDGRKRSAQFVDHLPPVMLPSRIGYAVAGDQHFWLDLLEAVDHRGRRHIRRTDAPDRADAGGGEKGDDGLRDVGEVGRDPIAGADAVRLEMDRERGGLAPQLRPAGFLQRAAFVAADDRRHVGGMRRLDMPKHLTRIVDLCSGKPDRARHLALRQHGGVRRRRAQLEIIPNALPEGVDLADGPLPQRLVIGEVLTVPLAQPAAVMGDMRGSGCRHRFLRSIARTAGNQGAIREKFLVRQGCVEFVPTSNRDRPIAGRISAFTGRGTRRANQQKPVQPSSQKYFAFAVSSLSSTPLGPSNAAPDTAISWFAASPRFAANGA